MEDNQTSVKASELMKTWKMVNGVPMKIRRRQPPWTTEEETVLRCALKVWNRDWTGMMQFLPGRTAKQIRNHVDNPKNNAKAKAKAVARKLEEMETFNTLMRTEALKEKNKGKSDEEIAQDIRVTQALKAIEGKRGKKRRSTSPPTVYTKTVMQPEMEQDRSIFWTKDKETDEAIEDEGVISADKKRWKGEKPKAGAIGLTLGNLNKNKDLMKEFQEKKYDML